MVAERIVQRGLVINGAKGLVQHVGISPDLRPLKESGDLINDIFRFSGLSDEEIAMALGLTQDQFLAFRSGYLEKPAKTTAIARDFLHRSMIEAGSKPVEEVAKWWRSEVVEGNTQLDVWVFNLSLQK